MLPQTRKSQSFRNRGRRTLSNIPNPEQQQKQTDATLNQMYPNWKDVPQPNPQLLYFLQNKGLQPCPFNTIMQTLEDITNNMKDFIEKHIDFLVKYNLMENYLGNVNHFFTLETDISILNEFDNIKTTYNATVKKCFNDIKICIDAELTAIINDADEDNLEPLLMELREHWSRELISSTSKNTSFKTDAELHLVLANMFSEDAIREIKKLIRIEKNKQDLPNVLSNWMATTLLEASNFVNKESITTLASIVSEAFDCAGDAFGPIKCTLNFVKETGLTIYDKLNTQGGTRKQKQKFTRKQKSSRKPKSKKPKQRQKQK